MAMALEQRYAADVLAALCVEKAFGGGRLGVFAENVPALDVRAFVSAIGRLAPKPVRVALLGHTASNGPIPSNVEVTTDPTVANRWRNDEAARKGRPGIFLVLGPAAKLNSLRTAVPVLTAGDVRKAIVRRCKALLETPERSAFFEAIAECSGEISTAALIAYASALEEIGQKGKAALMDGEPRLVRKLSLLPSASLFGASGQVAARRLVRKNLDLVRALRNLQPRSRDLLSGLIEGRHLLADRAAKLLRFESTGNFDDLRELTLEDIEETLRARIDDTKHPPPPPTAKRERLDGDALALDLVLNADGKGLGVAAKRFGQAIEPDPHGVIDTEEITIGRRTILPRVRVGTTQTTALFGKYLTEDVWGCYIATEEAVDFVGAQKLVASGDAQVEEFRPSEEHHVRGTLKKAVDRGIVTASALKQWDAYAEARIALLPHVAALIDHPLLALSGDNQVAQRAEALLAAYTHALGAINETAKALDGQGSKEAARRLIACALSLDVAFIRARGEYAAIAAPTHAFHLWRWISLRSIIAEHRDELQGIGQEALEPLVTDPPSVCPQILLSPYAVRGVDRGRPFIATGTFASLPLFGEATARQIGKFRARSLAMVAERLLRLMPHASLGLRVALIDPLSVAGALEDLLDLKSPFTEDDVPLHATILRTRAARESTDEEDDAVGTLARELTDQSGTLTVGPPMQSLKDVGDYLATNPAHVTVVFDPGVGERIAVGLAQPPTLSPLVVPRAYRYDAFDDRLDMIVAGDAQPFSIYHEMFCETLGIPRTDFIGRRSGASQSVRHLESIARSSVWTVVVDQAIEPTLRIGAAERLDWRTDGGRDVVTFTAHPETIEDLIDDAIRAAGLMPDEEMRKRVLSELFLLNGEAVLALAKARPAVSLADPRIAKATIGVLTANRWYTEKHPDSLLISLDDPTSRQWILGVGSDDRHGDLLGIRQTDEGVIVEALEVKAHDEEEAGVRVHGGTIEGRAVTQVDQTIATLRMILSIPQGSPVLRARLDVLRDQLYRAVASRPYSPDRRGRYVHLLEELFAKGPKWIAGVIFRVHIAPGRGAQASQSPAPAKSPAGNQVGVVDLVESGNLGKFHSPPPPQPSKPEVPPKPPGSGQRGAKGGGDDSGRPGDDEGTRGATAQPPTNDGSNDAAPPRPATPTPPTSGVRVLIGRTPTGSQVLWEPQHPDAPLNNFGILVTGDPGSGKTQMLKVLIAEAADLRLPVCIFDFKNDYSDPAFAEKHGLRVYDIDRQGLPFNPLSLIPDDRGEAQPIRQVHELVGILTRIFGLGSQQEARLRKAIVAAYEGNGIRADARHAVASVNGVPGFAEVKVQLGSDDKNEALLNRLSPLFDLNLFPDRATASTTFERLIQDRVVLDLHSLPDDRIKAAMSEFIIVRLHGYILKGEQPRELRRLLVFDEAWRVKDSVRLQELAREGRAFGVGILIGTQFPGDIPESLAGNVATQLLLSNQDPDHRKAVVRTLCGATSGPEAGRLTGQLAVLQKHEGFFRNQQYAPYALVETLPYYRRGDV
jgi:hypothetical protein